MQPPKPLRVLSMGWGKQTVALAYMAELGEIESFDFAVHAQTFEGKRTRDYIQRHAADFTKFPILDGRAREEVLRVVVQANTQVWTPVPAYSLAPKASGAVTGEAEFFGTTVDVSAVLPENGEMDLGQTNRQCTGHWKTDVIKRVISAQLADRGLPKTPGIVECSIGISWDESTRIKDSDVAYIINQHPLVDKRITRDACIQWLEDHGLEVPTKSACDFCPYQDADEWRATMQEPEDRARAIAADEAVRWARPDKGPLFIHPARIPLAEAVKLPMAHQIRLCDGLAGCGL